jgi:hypothetical protein
MFSVYLASTGSRSSTRFLPSKDRTREMDPKVEASGSSIGSRPRISEEEIGCDPTLVERRQSRCPRRNENCPPRVRSSENKLIFVNCNPQVLFPGRLSYIKM